MNCEEARPLIHAYADGELDLVNSLEVEAHLAGCADCAREQANVRALHEAFGDGALYHGAPAKLEGRIRAAARSARRAERPRGLALTHPGWRWVAAAAAIALVVLAARGVLPTGSTEDRVASEVVADHVRSLMVNHLTDVLSSSQHTVKPWFDGKIDFAPVVADLSAQGFVLVGGRLDYLDGRSVAALVYRRREHVINLFVWPVERQADAAPVSETRQGYNIVHWTRGGMAYWAVSNLNLAELQTFAQSVH